MPISFCSMPRPPGLVRMTQAHPSYVVGEGCRDYRIPAPLTPITCTEHTYYTFLMQQTVITRTALSSTRCIYSTTSHNCSTRTQAICTPTLHHSTNHFHINTPQPLIPHVKHPSTINPPRETPLNHNPLRERNIPQALAPHVNNLSTINISHENPQP